MNREVSWLPRMRAMVEPEPAQVFSPSATSRSRASKPLAEPRAMTSRIAHIEGKSKAASTPSSAVPR